MRSWADSTFVFISSNPRYDPGGVEDRWFALMAELIRLGATVRFLCLQDSPAGGRARALGAQVDPYILDKWNVVRSRSRLRKYLQRYVPVAAHSTGLEADLILRWAARKVPLVEVVHTLAADPQGTRRGRSVNALMRRFDELGMRSAAAVVVDTDATRVEVVLAGVPTEKILTEPTGEGSVRRSVAAHLNLYRGLMAGRGAAG
jgi:hypothetical protein